MNEKPNGKGRTVAGRHAARGRLRRRWLTVAVAAAAAVAGAFWFRQAVTPPQLSCTVEARDFPVRVMADGEVDTEGFIDVRAPTAPYERQVNWLAPEGAQVRKGDIVAQFDTQDAEAHLEVESERVVALVDKQETEKLTWDIDLTTQNVRLAQREEQRGNARLRKEGTSLEPPLPREVGERTFSVADLTAKQTQRRIKQLEKVRDVEIRRRKGSIRYRGRKVDAHEEYLEQYTVRAPADSIVLYPPIPVGHGVVRKVEPGDYLGRGQAFMRLPDFSTRVLKLRVPEGSIEGISVGSSLEFSARAYPGRQFTATVTSISNLAEEHPLSPARKSFEVVAEIIPTDGVELLRPGMLVEAGFVLEHHHNVLPIPIDLVRGAGGPHPEITVRSGSSSQSVPLPPNTRSTSDYILVHPESLPLDGNPPTLEILYEPTES